ncbi:MAG TPA: uroporphyrinogen-III synthase [Alphaproteobacteria bacterium]|nr:uroporphyrinogen-III synthase [Alphaproteobacteria bacterium]
MPSILITRPTEAAETLAAELQNLGYETVIEPLLAIKPLATPRPAITPQAIMITSGNALGALEKRRQEIGDLLALPCFCVGARTAEKARAFGFRKIAGAASDGDGLARRIGRAAGDSMLHIRGADADGKAAALLEAAGWRVADWPVYAAHPAAVFTPGTHALLAGGKFDAVTVFSPRTARVLADLIEAATLGACCARLAAICLSEAVTTPLQPLPWRHLMAAAAPTEDAVIDCLQKSCPVRP